MDEDHFLCTVIDMKQISLALFVSTVSVRETATAWVVKDESVNFYSNRVRTKKWATQ